MNYFPRHLLPTIARAVRTFPVVLVTGARQVGKTTLLRQEFESTHRYVSLERPDVRGRALADPVAFLRENSPPLILDEIQYAPALLHYIKEQVDLDRRPGSWLLTGSQSFPLMAGVSQSLAGRVAIVTLDPLSESEAARATPPTDIDEVLARVFGTNTDGEAGIPEPAPNPRGTGAVTGEADFGEALLRGGYPELRLNPEVDRELWFSSYVQTYLERDVRALTNVGDLETFGRFLTLVAARTGGLLNVSEIGRDVGVSGPTVKRWLSVLEASEVIFLLRPYHRNLGKRLIKSPKVYLLDTGLASWLLGLHRREPLLQGPSLGALAETAVVAEWVKALRSMGEQPALHFWRTSGGEEVDLLIEREGVLHAIEVKATATPMPHHADSLARFLALAGPGVRGVLACRIEGPAVLRPGIRAVPWHLAW